MQTMKLKPNQTLFDRTYSNMTLRYFNDFKNRNFLVL